jgi:signal transduction histidine kinase
MKLLNKINVYKLGIISGMIAFAVVSFILILKIYNVTLQETKTTHQQQQMQMAKTAVQGIKYYLGHLVGDMYLLHDILNNQNYNNEEAQLNLDYYLNHYEKNIVRSIFVTDTSEDIIYTTSTLLPNWINIEMQKFVDSGDSIWYSMIKPYDEELDDEDFFFVILSQKKQYIHHQLEEEKRTNTLGIIGYLISFDRLMDQFITPLKLGQSDFAWVLDGNGRLIFHPRHEKMLLRSVKDTSSECRECHSSFEVQKQMLSSDVSVGEYTIGEEPTKIMAYVPVKFSNERWILAISTFLPEVTANLREKFRLFFILGFIILGVIIFFGSLVYYINLRRIRAEEEKRSLEQLGRYQEQLNQASKLASIGELVDTVAHEINTPTGIIAAHADAIIIKENYSDDIANALKIIRKQTRRISDYTRSILSYSQSIPFLPEPINIEELMNECTYLLDHRFQANNIKVIKNIESNLSKVVLDKRQMEQVFINLLNNAVDSIKNSGEIKISLNKEIVESELENEKNERIAISIEDNGIGIKDDYIDKIFNPFFSTKSKAQGTGLGLAITKAIVVRHKGKINVTSNEGKGTKFQIYLPINVN